MQIQGGVRQSFQCRSFDGLFDGGRWGWGGGADVALIEGSLSVSFTLFLVHGNGRFLVSMELSGFAGVLFDGTKDLVHGVVDLIYSMGMSFNMGARGDLENHESFNG